MTMKKLRRVQQDVVGIASKIKRGEPITTILTHAHPGSGKSWLPPLLLSEIRTRHRNAKLLWVVPRSALREQGAKSCEEFDLQVNEVVGEPMLPADGYDGYITTYDSIRKDSMAHEQELDRHEYLLVLDEFHHIRVGPSMSDDDDSPTMKSIVPVANKAHWKLLMSGSWDRHDQQQIGFMPYFPNSRGDECPVSEDTKHSLSDYERFVRYSRRDALDEHAILPIKFFHHDGEVKMLDKTAEELSLMLSVNYGDEESAAGLFWAVRSEFGTQLLNLAVDHWMTHRQSQATAKLLIICADIKHANAIHKLLAGRHLNVATSHTENDKNNAIIKNFKNGLHDILVTVGKAYEGLDVPTITHCCILTHIRSRQWIDQAINRATRVCSLHGRYQDQTAFLFLPDDWRMNQIIHDIQKELVDVLVMTSVCGEGRKNGRDSGNGLSESTMAYVASGLTKQRSSYLDDRIKEQLRPFIFEGIPEEKAMRILLAQGAIDPEQVLSEGVITTEDMREHALRLALNSKIWRLAGEDKNKMFAIRDQIRKKYKIDQSNMKKPQLEILWADFNEQYPNK